MEQGPRQGPRYSKEMATIAKIYIDNQKACQGVPAYRTASSIVTWEKEHPSQRAYTAFTDRHYHNQDQGRNYDRIDANTDKPIYQCPKLIDKLFMACQGVPVKAYNSIGVG